jgi:dipeptidyl aminopeptidase/acylaminoacyl peptidase
LAFVFATASAHAAPFDDRVAALFRPPLAEQMALSPDGHRVAYTTQVGKDLVIMIMDVEFSGPKLPVIVDEERSVAFSQDKERAQLRFLKWATADRLVFSPTEHIVNLPSVALPGREPNSSSGDSIIYSPIMAVDADGRNPKVLIDADEFVFYPPEPLRGGGGDGSSFSPQPTRQISRHLDIVGFAPDNREELLIEARGIRRQVETERYALNIRTGKYRSVEVTARPKALATQVVDEYRREVVGLRKNDVRPVTAWRDTSLAEMQRELERKFPRRTVEIVEWCEDRTRVLVRVTGGSDPGRVFVYQRPENLVLEIFRRAPWLNSGNLHDTRFFEFDAPDGAHLSGYLTWPNRPRLQPPPLLVCFPTGFPGRAQPEFDPEAQVFADLGFIVLRLNHRYVAGIKPEERATLSAEIDRLSVSDALTAIDWIAERNPWHPVDRKRIATLGRGFGGYLALRALQLHSEVFRCAVAIDAPPDLRPWLWPPPSFEPASRPLIVTDLPRNLFDAERTDWKKLSVVAQADALTLPVFLLVEPTRNPVIDATTAELRAKLKALKRAPDFLELDPGFGPGFPKARATTYRKIEEFFNLRLYDYDVRIGPVKEVK